MTLGSIKLKGTAALVGAVFAFAAFGASAEAQEKVLRLSSWVPPAHPLVADMMVPWAEQVEAATDGRVKVQILDAPLGPPPAHFDLVRNGVADLAYGVHSYSPGRFQLTEIAELPFIADNAEALSVAYWRLHNEMLADKGENAGVKVLGVFAHGPGMLWTSGKDVAPLSDLDGYKVRVPGSMTGALAEQLGMVSIQVPATQVFELLSGGVADGLFFPPESVPFFKLDGLVKKALRADGQLNNTSFFFIMNERAFDGLSEEDQAAIEKVSGEAFVSLAGKAWDAADARAMETLSETVEIHDATDEEMTVLREAAQPLYDAVRANYEAKGVDFDAALAFLEAQIAELTPSN